MSRPTLTLLLLLTLLLAACGQGTTDPASSGMDHTAMPMATTTDDQGGTPMAGSSEMNPAAMNAAMEEMTGLSGDEFEVMFLDAMIPHHQSAIDMAEVALDRAQRPEVKAAAQAIITAQEAEVEQMATWLQAWHGQTPSGDDHGMAMPDEVERLRTLPAEEFDAAFLVAMIPHHEDAIHMAEMVPARTQRPELTALSQAIIQSQQAEIEQFNGWLKE